MIKLKNNKLFKGDALRWLKKFPSSSVDLIVTSPPYANKRMSSYGGTKPENYIEWFLPITSELYRVLKSDGSFVLNIKEGVNIERQTYVLELILELKKQGWLWIDEYIWRKSTSMPGKWPNRLRDGWERCLHFTKNKKFNMFQDSVMVPVGDWAKKRMIRLSKNDVKRTTSSTKSGLGRNLINWKNRELVYPDNVLEFAPLCYGSGHSAAFPKELPTWFIKLFTRKGDVVLDPFIGSGTTAVASLELGRKFVGIELKKDYYNLALRNIKETKKNC